MQYPSVSIAIKSIHFHIVRCQSKLYIIVLYLRHDASIFLILRLTNINYQWALLPRKQSINTFFYNLTIERIKLIHIYINLY